MEALWGGNGLERTVLGVAFSTESMGFAALMATAFMVIFMPGVYKIPSLHFLGNRHLFLSLVNLLQWIGVRGYQPICKSITAPMCKMELPFRGMPYREYM